MSWHVMMRCYAHERDSRMALRCQLWLHRFIVHPAIHSSDFVWRPATIGRRVVCAIRDLVSSGVGERFAPGKGRIMRPAEA
jgi:hypothetical protein